VPFQNGCSFLFEIPETAGLGFFLFRFGRSRGLLRAKSRRATKRKEKRTWQAERRNRFFMTKGCFKSDYPNEIGIL